MQPKHDMPMPGEDDNTSDNFGPYKNKKSTLEVQDIERDYRDLVDKSSDTGSRARAGHTPQDGLLESESSLFLREVRFSEQEFLTSTPPYLTSNIITRNHKMIIFFISFIISWTMH